MRTATESRKEMTVGVGTLSERRHACLRSRSAFTSYTARPCRLQPEGAGSSQCQPSLARTRVGRRARGGVFRRIGSDSHPAYPVGRGVFCGCPLLSQHPERVRKAKQCVLGLRLQGVP